MTLDPAVAERLRAQRIELPVVGLRQLRHPVQGVRPAGRAPRPVREDRRRRPGAPLHRASRRRVALHIPWDKVDDYARPGRARRRPRRRASARSTPTPSRTTTTSSAASATPTPRVRRKAIDHLLECVDIMDATGSRDLKLWFADGTNYPGQDDIRARQDRLAESLRDDLRAARRGPAAGAGVQVLRARVLHHRRPRLGHRPTPTAWPWANGRWSCLDTGHHAPGHQHRVHRRAAAAARASSAPSTSTPASTPTTT